MPVNQRGPAWQATVVHKGSRWRRDFPTKPEAAKWEIESKARLLNNLTPEMPNRSRTRTNPNAVTDGRPRTIGELAEVVIQRHWKRKRSSRNLAKASALAREVATIIGPGTPLDDIRVATVSNLKEHLYGLGNSSSTVNRKLAALSMMLTYADEHEWLSRRVRVKRDAEGDHRTRYITEAEEADMLAWTSHRGLDWFHDLIVLAIDTGLRMGEMLQLTNAHVSDRMVTVWITKSGKPRSVPLTARAEAALTRRISEVGTQRLFQNAAGRGFYDLWHTMLRELGIDDPQVVPHAMRHTFCSRLVMRGAQARTIQELAGHSSIMVTQRYMHLAPATLRGAIDLLEGRAATHAT
jgi:site-specific recombinase XerD